MNESFWKMEAISDSGVDTRRRLVDSNVIKNTTQSREKGLKKLVSPPPRFPLRPIGGSDQHLKHLDWSGTTSLDSENQSTL